MSDEQKSNISLSQVLDAGVRKYGKSILSNLAVAIKVTRLYSFAHHNVSQAVKEVLEFLNSFIRLEGEVSITRVEDYLFLNEVRVRVDLEGHQSFLFVLDLLKARDIGEITFAGGLSEKEIETLVELFNKHAVDPARPWDSFTEGLKKFRMPNITFGQHEARREATGEVDDDSRVVAIRTYFKSIGAMKETLQAAAEGRKINLKRLKLAVHALVDLTLKEERLLLALANTKRHLDGAANHAVNVAVLSIAVGAKLGLSKKLLGDLGIAALLHDVGRVKLPAELQFPCMKRLNPRDAETYRTHVSHGVERMLTQRLVNAVVKSINVAFLHHYRYDSTGYPKLVAGKKQNLYTRIVAVADYYDNATTPARLAERPQTPDVVVRGTMDRRGTEFDPLVVKAFINLMGLYPVGCVVRLDTGEVGTVVEPSSQPRFLDRPTLKLICDAAGNPKENRINLLERGPDGRFLRTIVKIYQQDEIQLQLEEYLAVI